MAKVLRLSFWKACLRNNWPFNYHDVIRRHSHSACCRGHDPAAEPGGCHLRGRGHHGRPRDHPTLQEAQGENQGAGLQGDPVRGQLH